MHKIHSHLGTQTPTTCDTMTVIKPLDIPFESSGQLLSKTLCLYHRPDIQVTAPDLGPSVSARKKSAVEAGPCRACPSPMPALAALFS